MEVRAGSLTVDAADGPMELYEALPDGEARAALIVVHEAFGLNGHIESVTRRFAGEGFHSVAPDLYHRAGGGTASYDDFSRVAPLMEGLDDERLLMDVDAARSHLRAQGFRDWQTGLVGFCMGGRVSFLVAARRRLGAVVGFYGGGLVHPRRSEQPALVGEAATLKSPWLGLFGDLDPHVPVEDAELLRKALDGASVATEVIRYADAGHGFFCDERPDYQPEAAADAWRRTLAWLERHLDL
jgi:carboxymethylenebutenolidase